MDVSKFQLQGEWLKMEIESQKKDKKLEIKVKPLSSNEQIDLGEAAKGGIKKFLHKIHDLVLDWDLKKGEEKVPCTNETKNQYLPYLINLKIKGNEAEKKKQEKDEKGKEEALRTVGLTVLEFAQNFDNFIKN